MKTLRWLTVAAGILAGAGLVGSAEPAPKAGGDARQWDAIVEKAIGYLKTNQADDSSWSGKRSPGVTGIVLTGLLRTGKVGPDDPVAAKALGYIEGLVNPEAGHIAGRAPRVQLQN